MRFLLYSKCSMGAVGHSQLQFPVANESSDSHFCNFCSNFLLTSTVGGPYLSISHTFISSVLFFHTNIPVTFSVNFSRAEFRRVVIVNSARHSPHRRSPRWQKSLYYFNWFSMFYHWASFFGLWIKASWTDNFWDIFVGFSILSRSSLCPFITHISENIITFNACYCT